MTDAPKQPNPARANPRPIHIVLGACALAGMVAIAWARMGALGLPSVASSVTPESAGLANLGELHALDQFIRGAGSAKTWPLAKDTATASDVARDVRDGLMAIQHGNVEWGLQLIQRGLRREPQNLVLSNTYRMAVFQLQREFLASSRERGVLTPEFPSHLANEPIALLSELDRAHSTAETKLALALAWVDKMLLFPALEIKAPSSVESVDILTGILETDPYYVPALFARGLNHLHRPARLVWPKAAETPIDAAAQDIAKCVAIGRKVGAGSARLQATLAIALGDSYVKAGRLGVARSWWQIAQNLCGDDDLQQSIRRRYGWSDGEVLDRLEEELDRARAELDRPMTDLAMMWN